MAVFNKGTFSMNLGFIAVGGEFDNQDRQCAWELYTEIVTRVAVHGKLDEKRQEAFDGEVLVESLSSLYNFFMASREIMRRYPVGELSIKRPEVTNHLGFFIATMLDAVLRPFLETWQATYRHWWDQKSDRSKTPFKRQEEFPQLAQFKKDWITMRGFFRQSADELAKTYKLIDLGSAVAEHVRQAWLVETRRVTSLSK